MYNKYKDRRVIDLIPTSFFMRLFFCVFTLIFLSGCYSLLPSDGGGQTKGPYERKTMPEDVALPEGYQLEVVAEGLTFPTGITFDERGTPYVIEAGYSYGEVWLTPRLLRIVGKGEVEEIARGGRNGPWNGVDYYQGAFYVAEGGQKEGGKILKITPGGDVAILIENLPSIGDHHTNGPEIGPDGAVYFGQGTATNAAVAGSDNAQFGWLTRHPDFHDIPCKDIVLNGVNFSSENPLTEDPGDQVTTGAYVPLGKSTVKGQVIRGQIPCSGAIFRITDTSSSPELIAWGLRNPFGMAFSPDGMLYVTENSFDVRGSRPVWGSGDYLWKIEKGRWYGWPDYAGGMPIHLFKPPGEQRPEFLLQEHPNKPPQPTAALGVHSSSNGMDFSSGSEFGYHGDAFIAQFGDMAPQVGKVIKPVGFKVVRVERDSGTVYDFAVNKGKRNGPASWLNSGGLERPVDVAFNPVDNALYIVDFGILRISENSTHPVKNTGVVWKVTKRQ